MKLKILSQNRCQIWSMLGLLLLHFSATEIIAESPPSESSELDSKGFDSLDWEP